MPEPPSAYLWVEEQSAALKFAGLTDPSQAPSSEITYPFNGSNGSGGVSTKWEGSALLVNQIVNGPTNYTVMERWKTSNNGALLTIRRTVVRRGGEEEFLLVYDNIKAAPASLDTRQDETSWRRASQQEAAPKMQPTEFLLEPGTRILLRLTNSVNTRNTTPGSRIYLETAVPVYSQGKLIIPRGSYVMGTVTEAQRAGRVKGKASLNLRFETLTLPNGVTRDFRSRPGSVDSKGNLDASEGRIKGEGNKGGDAKTVGQTAGAGAGVGGLIGAASGHAGMGAGIGAAAGAAGALIGVLGSRGPDVMLPSGTTMELVLDRQLVFNREELGR